MDLIEQANKKIEKINFEIETLKSSPIYQDFDKIKNILKNGELIDQIIFQKIGLIAHIKKSHEKKQDLKDDYEEQQQKVEENNENVQEKEENIIKNTEKKQVFDENLELDDIPQFPED